MKSRKGMARIAFGSVGITLILASCTADLGWEEEGTMNPYASPAAATFKSVNGEVVIEAESYTRLGGTIGGTWFIDKKLSGYTGSGYIQSTTGGGKTAKFDKDIMRAEYDINFKETGRYYLHLRTYAVDHTQNGFFATLDGQPIDYGYIENTHIHVGKRSKWWWLTKGGGPHGTPPGEYKVSIDITKNGIQTLAIYRRDSGGSRIDQIWLTKKQSAHQNTGTLKLTDSAVFIDGGGKPYTDGGSPAADAQADRDGPSPGDLPDGHVVDGGAKPYTDGGSPAADAQADRDGPSPGDLADGHVVDFGGVIPDPDRGAPPTGARQSSGDGCAVARAHPPQILMLLCAVALGLRRRRA